MRATLVVPFTLASLIIPPTLVGSDFPWLDFLRAPGWQYRLQPSKPTAEFATAAAPPAAIRGPNPAQPHGR